MQDMMVLTSAKSTLTVPGMLMMSLMPRTALTNTSSAILKASIMLSWGGDLQKALIGDRDERVDALTQTGDADCQHACGGACPSKANGLVTTATVKAPSSRAICATMEAPPVPVPPPMPAVMKTMSAPERISWISCRLPERVAPNVGIGAGAEAAGQIFADLSYGKQVRSVALARRCCR